MLSVIMLCRHAECHYAECHHAECRSTFPVHSTLALPANNRIGCKGLSARNTLAYFPFKFSKGKMKFYLDLTNEEENLLK
jgi:hypothetical protein